MKPTVMLVFGGQSSEHNVSCLTAAGVANAIDQEKYQVEAVGISKTGQWYRIPVTDVAKLQTESGQLPEVSNAYPQAVLVKTDDGANLASVSDSRLVDQVKVDVAFTVLHGPFGEDGTIQGMFEMMGLRYVGAGVLGSCAGMDKHITKIVLQSYGIPIGPYRVIHPEQWGPQVTDEQRQMVLNTIDELEYPVFVKPARGGSSVGISKVDSADQLAAAIDLAHQHDPKVIVEQGIMNAREVECAVLGPQTSTGQVRTSKLGEISMVDPNSFYDYEAKYLPENQVQLHIPAKVSRDIEEKVTDIARRTFRAVECEGLARVDTFVTQDGEVLVNEINTMPGFTPFSMFPLLWQETGLDYPSLITELIELACQRPVGLR